eukprot:scaffold67510_cov47-Phaeocystis_antarctica.AAC.1
MERMLVTLEVSKLSGWLNNDARCRESKGGHTVWCEVHSTGRREAGGRPRCTQRAGEGSTADWEQGSGRRARIEAQRLIEQRRALPRVERRAYGVGRGRGEVQSTRRREVAGDRGASGVQGRARLQVGGRARGGAHAEHGAHVFGAGGVEAQRSVERRRGLPR